MKLNRAIAAALIVALCVPLGVASADDADQKRVKKNRDSIGALDAKTMNSSIRVSEMIGMNIQNQEGESVGEVKDIVLDADNGKVRYAAVTYGGFLGVGNKMFAVPYEAFRCQPDPDDPSERVLVLNVSQEQLKNATGFDEDHWPNFADRKFTRDLDELYGVDRRTGNRKARERNTDE